MKSEEEYYFSGGYGVYSSLVDALSPPREVDASLVDRLSRKLWAVLLLLASLVVFAYEVVSGFVRYISDELSPSFSSSLWPEMQEVDYPSLFHKANVDQSAWKEFDSRNCELPKEILAGVATCDYQYLGMKGAPHSQWKEYELSCIATNKRSSGLSPNTWVPANIVRLLKKLNVNAYRFSVEWSNIEPQPAEYQHEQMQRYVALCDALLAAKIEPLVTLHHFSQPHWFNFEKEENINHFVAFAEYVVKAFGNKVTYYNTINEPGIAATLFYAANRGPPGGYSPTMAGTVLKNMMKAHCAVFRKIKELNTAAQVGISHQVAVMQPYRWWNPIDRITAYFVTYFANEVVLRFFETGIFEWKFPLICNIYWAHQNAINCNDFIGVQAYSRVLLSFGLSTHLPNEENTMMNYREDPCAAYQAAIMCYRRLKKPIIITETGIAPISDKQRKRFLKRNLYAICQLPKQGVDLRGVFLWSLYKNFEWSLGLGDLDFGLLKFDQQTNDYVLQEGADFIAQKFNDVAKTNK